MNASRSQFYYFLLIFASFCLIYSVSRTAEICPLSTPVQYHKEPVRREAPAVILKEKKENFVQSVSIDVDPQAKVLEAETDIEINGHEIRFNKIRPPNSPEKLRIHLIMHSHVDPGWLLTFEEYYEQQTTKILDQTVSALVRYKDLRFIWSEISFLERWWRDATELQKKTMKELISSGRLEITGGAWVMTDEATPTFYSAIENLIEGHQFIYDTFKIRPNVSWSVDPFGHGSMMPYLLPYSGIDSMVIGRYHGHLKHELRQQQSLRWKWVDRYSQRNDGPMINSLPYFVYTTEYACEDNSLCRCFHVGPSNRMPCYGDQLSKATPFTIGNFTLQWLDQMRRAQKVYGTEDILVAIGDDFYFQQKEDFDEFHRSFKWMSYWLEQHPQYNAEMRFSTVSEFFSSIRDQSVPTLKGDLFPYTSNMNNPQPWWTGYFAHRPYSKIMERILQNSLRSLDLASSLNKRVVDFEKLRDAKRNFSVFQHHDGITGTSKPHVMIDYELRMQQSFDAFSEMFGKTVLNNVNAKMVYGIINRELVTIDMEDGKSKYLVFFNPLTQPNNHILKFQSNAIVDVLYNGAQLDSQWSTDGDGYVITFFYELCPLTHTTFEIRKSQFEKKKTESEQWIIMDKEGRVGSVKTDNVWKHLRFELHEYQDDGGAYVMELSRLQSKEIMPVSVETEDGPLYTRKIIKYGNMSANPLEMRITSYPEKNFIDVEIDTELTDETTLMMNIKAAIRNGNEFYTDINNLYHARRTYQSFMEIMNSTYNNGKLPLEANFYPISTSAFIQDGKQRLTLLTGQSTGGTSKQEGEITVIVDRRLSSDDGKGLGYQDAYDNRSARVKYRLIFEERTEQSKHLPSHSLSLRSYNELDALLYSPVSLYSHVPVENGKCLTWQWPCPIQLVSFRPLSQKKTLLVLRRISFDQSIPAGCSANLVPLFEFLAKRSLRHTSLTGTVDGTLVTFRDFQNSLQDPYAMAAFTLSNE